MFSKIAFWRKPPTVVLLGPPGVGKTSLLHSLGDQSLDAPLLSTVDRTESILGVEGHSLKVVEIPDRDWERHIAAVAESSPIGVIIVTAYGYHSPETFETSVSGNDPEALQQWLDCERLAELEILETQFDACLKHVEAVNSRDVDWVLTIVNKADLWWDSKADVEVFYRNNFRRILLDILRRYEKAEKAMPMTKYYSCRTKQFLKGVNPATTFNDDERWELVDGLRSALAEAVNHSATQL